MLLLCTEGPHHWVTCCLKWVLPFIRGIPSEIQKCVSSLLRAWKAVWPRSGLVCCASTVSCQHMTHGTCLWLELTAWACLKCCCAVAVGRGGIILASLSSQLRSVYFSMGLVYLCSTSWQVWAPASVLYTSSAPEHKPSSGVEFFTHLPSHKQLQETGKKWYFP